MLTGRFLLMFVVMTATLGVRRPVATLAEPAGGAIERVTFTQRLGTGLARPLTRIGLLRRVALHVPAPRLVALSDRVTAARHSPIFGNAYRTCLPPPRA